MAEPRLLDIPTAAAYLGMTAEALRKKVERRQIPFVRTGKRAVRLDRVELDRWIDDNRVEAAS